MRVLTVRQPWAWAIIHGGKDVENRTRSLGPYRGPVAIHAGQAHAREAWCDATLTNAAARFGLTQSTYTGLDLPVGSVLGVVDLVDAHPDCRERVDGFGYTVTCSFWAMPGHHHLALANPRPLARPIPAKGRLGLWTPDVALDAAIWEQIGGAA